MDFLTRLANRTSLHDELKLETQRSRRYGHSLTLASIDHDNFAGFNERKGHSTVIYCFKPWLIPCHVSSAAPS